jgi:hypothetical protein
MSIQLVQTFGITQLYNCITIIDWIHHVHVLENTISIPNEK